jgi:hypothetical protein
VVKVVVAAAVAVIRTVIRKRSAIILIQGYIYILINFKL